MKLAIQSGQVTDAQKAIAEYNQLAAQQRAERDHFKEMAARYNEKVAKLRELQP